jgi:inhibitor of cysteine peptidase
MMPVLTIDHGSAERAVELKLGETMEVRLAENPSTGFRWIVAADGEPNCSLVGERAPGGATRPGQPRQHRWQIRGKAAGRCEVELVYRRPWETAAPAQIVSLHIRVTK